MLWGFGVFLVYSTGISFHLFQNLNNVFLFSFSSKHFLISFLSPLINGYLFQNIRDFPVSFLLLDFYLIPLWPHNILCMIWTLKYTGDIFYDSKQRSESFSVKIRSKYSNLCRPKTLSKFFSVFPRNLQNMKTILSSQGNIKPS